MTSPEAKAKWVLETHGIADNVIPAEALEEIADSAGLKHRYEDFPEDAWDGMLLFTNRPRAILVNTHIGNAGRHHFTFAHELGHYFLNHEPAFSTDGQRGFRCTVENNERTQPRMETDANRFAVELLMPQNQFRLEMAGAPLDFTLIGSLAARFMVSKHASSNRILDITREPSIIVRTRGTKIEGWKESCAARGFLHQLVTVPAGTEALHVIAKKKNQNGFNDCDAGKWLRCAVPNQKVYECTRGNFDTGVAMTIIKW